MSQPKSREDGKKSNVLPIRADANLPNHKTSVTLDDLDREILEMHQEDVFFSYNDLAEKWDVTVATIRNRIKRLKENGVMNVILVMNPYKIGYETFATIGIKLEPKADVDQVAELLLVFPGVISLVMVAGQFDFFVDFVCQNMEEYRKFISLELRMIPGVADVMSFLWLEMYEHKFDVSIISR